MKKVLSVCLIAFIAIVSVMANGTAESAGASSAAKTESASANVVNPRGVFPVVKESVTLRMAIQGNPQVTDFVDNDFTRWVEEQTGIKLIIDVLPTKDLSTKLNLMFAAGKDLPDIINVGTIPNDALYKYALDGLVLPLDGYMDTYGEDYQKMLTDNPALRNACIAPDGHIYGIPKFNLTLHNMMRQGKMYLYKPWLDKLGLAVPTTLDELHDVLVAFKTQDPNGNGLADEVPMAGATTGACTDPLPPFIDAFIPYDFENYGLLNQNGTIVASYTMDEFKQGLAYVRQLVAEGLLSPVSFTQDQQQLKQLANREMPILGGFVHGYTAVNSNSPRVPDYICLPLMDGGTDKGGFLNDPLLPKGASFVITSSCKNPEAAYRLGDFLVGGKAGMRARWGVEGRDWKWIDHEKTDFVGMDGKNAYFEVMYNFWEESGNVSWRTDNLIYRDYINVFGQGMPASMFNPNKYHYDNSIKYYKPYVVGDVVPLGSLFFTEDELSDYSLIATSLHDHVRSQLAAFATGSRSLDQWGKFQRELKDLGLDQYLAYIQKAYDRQFGNK